MHFPPSAAMPGIWCPGQGQTGLLPAVIFAPTLALGFDSLERFVLSHVRYPHRCLLLLHGGEYMGGDGELAGEFVVLESTAVSVITNLLWVLALR